MMEIELKDVSKAFGPLRAVNDVSLKASSGEIVALLGDNGAGKSTLLKMIAGAVQMDSGEMIVGGVPLRPKSPREAEELGIEMVYQDLALVETLEVVQNFYLAREIRKPGLLGKIGFLDKKAMLAKSSKYMEGLGVRISSVRRPVEVLSGGQRQGIAIARAYARASESGAGVVCFDEPTAALGVEQSAGVFDCMRRLQERGLISFIVTHNLPQALDIATRVIVMRHGFKVADLTASDASVDELVALITGAREGDLPLGR